MIDARIAEVTGHSLNGSILRKHYIDPGTVKIKPATVCAVAPDMPPVAEYERKQYFFSTSILHEIKPLPGVIAAGIVDVLLPKPLIRGAMFY